MSARAAVLLVAALAAGCGGGEDRERPPVEVRVAEQGFTQVGGSVFVGAVLRNEAGEPAEGVEVSFEARDADGGVVGSTAENLVVVPAREGFNVGVELELEEGARAEDVAVEVAVGEEDAFAGDEVPPGLPRVTSARVEHELGVGLAVLARAENTLAEPISPASDVYAVLRDGGGRIVGGLTSVTLQEEWPPGADAELLLTAEPRLSSAVDADVSVDAETGR